MALEELRRQIDTLSADAQTLVLLLTRMLEEGRTLAQNPGAKVNWRWVEEATTNLQNYARELLRSNL
jgi:hypothetical protein